mmetsp:Transcript_9313/g.14813  ORF Transcript_9313/g.14813 Transcript_9313/m.14813 type:complete len:129 (+) Transcript_9313:195-581(+)
MQNVSISSCVVLHLLSCTRAVGMGDKIRCTRIMILQANERVDGVLWMAGPLMNYMKNPRQLAQGNVQMNFRGIPDFQTRVDIIHYMKTLDWTNEKITAIPEKPSSFPPMRWYQNVMKGQPLKSPTQSA